MLQFNFDFKFNGFLEFKTKTDPILGQNALFEKLLFIRQSSCNFFERSYFRENRDCASLHCLKNLAQYVESTVVMLVDMDD